MRNPALSYAQTHREDALAKLQALVRIPSISTLPDYRPAMEQAAQWLADYATEIGLQNVAIMSTEGQPIVYADWLAADPQAPTLLIYGHYDVQPIDPLEEWQTPPFEATIKGDKLYGRGTSDNKGQHLIHLAAVAAYLKSSGTLPLNVKFLLEGEEEIGSPNLRAFIEAHQSLLQADVAVISDTSMIDPDSPAIVMSVRGLTYLEVTFRGSDRDLHSGGYGGAVENPLNALVRVLASLHDKTGRVTIPGFYNRVRELTTPEKELINHSLVTEEKILQETGAPALWGETGYTVAERLSTRPTLDIHGIRGGFIGEGQKTVIPATASAKVSMRLVPDQQATEIAELFSQHIKQISPPTMTVSIKQFSAENGAVIDITTPAVEAATKAYELCFGKRPVFLGEGGSLPIVAQMGEILHLPVVMMGFGLPDDQIHAPNERFHLPNLYRGIETAIHYYDILSKM